MRKPLHIEANGRFSVFICPRCSAMTMAGANAHPRHRGCDVVMRRAGLPADGTLRVDITSDENHDTPRK